jgi:methylenetetrahydrofolate reductase (NADPH)
LESIVQNYLRAALQSGEFFCSAELVLGRDHSVPEAEAFVRDASQHAEGIKVISLTDLPGGHPALPPEAFIPFVAQHGLTPVAHLTGKDGNRSFVEGRLHALARMECENLVVLTGDAQSEAYLGKAKPVYDLDSVLILRLIQEMREGLRYDIGPRKAQSSPFDFLPGAVVNPYKCREPDQMMQFYKLELKIACGARFIIPQLGFNLRKLFELRQYMVREGLDHVPVIADIYVPTATIAKMMKSGEIAGCVVSDELIKRLQGESKAQRMDRAALMMAAVRELGFAGAHVGGFGLSHKDFMTILKRSREIGSGWKARVEELIFEYPGEFYLLPKGTDGLSDAQGTYQTAQVETHANPKLKFAEVVHRLLVKQESPGARFFSARLHPENDGSESASWRSGFWYNTLGASSAFRKLALGCLSCGDCIQEHLNFAGCTMRWCYKGLRNGPCGGSRPDGTCEAEPGRQCIWNEVYLTTLGAKQDPRRFARTLIPPRDWSLDHTNALANRLVGLDNYPNRKNLETAARQIPSDEKPGD